VDVGKPSLLRALNLRVVFELLHQEGPMSATAIARVTGLSKPTVSQVVAQLLELGLIRRAGSAKGAVGPKAQLFAIDRLAGAVLALDIGREAIRGSIVDLMGDALATTSATTPATTSKRVLAQVGTVVTKLVRQAEIDPDRICQGVVGTPGVIRPGEDHLSLVPQLPGFESSGVLGRIADLVEAPVVFENDVNLAAMGEHAGGVARGCDEFVFVSIGAGVGMGAVHGGSLLRGASGLAGEIGYLPLPAPADTGAPTRSGRWREGSFEQWVSAAAVVECAREHGLGEACTAAEVFERAAMGEDDAATVVDVIAQRLGNGIAAIAAVLDPEMVVLGGDVGCAGGQPLADSVIRTLTKVSPFRPRIAISRLGAEATLTGAVELGLRLALEGILVDRAVDHDLTGEPGDHRHRPNHARGSDDDGSQRAS
jgi:predicted NBD/HSP70 family sugar kinase